MDAGFSTLPDSYPTGTSATGGLRNPWRECRALPSGPAAALAALHLTEPEWSGIRRLSDREWKQALQYCDRFHLTLWLRRVTRDAMPGWVRERTEWFGCRMAPALEREVAALPGATLEWFRDFATAGLRLPRALGSRSAARASLKTAKRRKRRIDTRAELNQCVPAALP